MKLKWNNAFVDFCFNSWQALTFLLTFWVHAPNNIKLFQNKLIFIIFWFYFYLNVDFSVFPHSRNGMIQEVHVLDQQDQERNQNVTFQVDERWRHRDVITIAFDPGIRLRRWFRGIVWWWRHRVPESCGSFRCYAWLVFRWVLPQMFDCSVREDFAVALKVVGRVKNFLLKKNHKT